MIDQLRTSTESASAPAPRSGVSRRGRRADILAIVVLMVVQAAGAGVALLSCIVLPMSIDNCAYEACGAEKWITWAIGMQFGSIAIAVLFVLAGLIMFARNRIGSWIISLGCVVQWSIIVAGWWVAGLAGPVAG